MSDAIILILIKSTTEDKNVNRLYTGIYKTLDLIPINNYNSTEQNIGSEQKQ